MQPLKGQLVVDLTRYLPGPFASRELLRLGARIVHVEPPGGDPLRAFAPAWHAALNAGKESVVCDLKAEPELVRGLLAQADVVLAGFRPGVAERLGVGPDAGGERTVYCSVTGFGADDTLAGHDLNYLGWAGALADTAPAMPPLPVADVGGGLAIVAQVLAALLEREQTGRGARLTVSLTHTAHRLVAHRLGGEQAERLLTGALACYRIYGTADGRHLTVAPLEKRFFARLCDLLGRPELASRQWDEDQEALAAELAEAFAERPLHKWLEVCAGEDVCVGPVATLDEAAERLGSAPLGPPPGLGEHTERWRDRAAAQPGRVSPSAAGNA